MKAVGYIRVSTEGQVREGASLEAQRAAIEAWAAAQKYTLVACHLDAGVSGAISTRPGLAAALDRACAEKAALVVYSLSRLARSTKDTLVIAERLERADADLVSLSERIDTTSAAGKMVFRLMAVLAEFERDLASERTRAALSHLKAQGKRTGTVPYGWALGEDMKSLAPVEHEQQAIRQMLSWHRRGCSLRKIASTLERRGVPSKTGVRWQPETVRGILRRARDAGGRGKSREAGGWCPAAIHNYGGSSRGFVVPAPLPQEKITVEVLPEAR